MLAKWSENRKCLRGKEARRKGSSSPSQNMQLLLLFTLLLGCNGLIHHLTIRHDDRHIFKIETFGFLANGRMDIEVQDFSIRAGKNLHNFTSTTKHGMDLDQRRLSVLPYKAGFVMRHAESESLAQQDLETLVERNQCIFDHLQDNDVDLVLTDTSRWQRASLVEQVSPSGVGLYSLVFAQCSNSAPLFVSFKLDAAFSNPGPIYLSAGDAPLPALYLAFFVVFAVLTAIWAFLICKKDTASAVHTIHYYMLLLLVFKCLSLLAESARLHYISHFGVSEMWSAIYYIFATLKGILLFVVIMLIGTGYSLMKNYLTDQDKRIILVVLVLQVIDNIAMVVLEETAPGSLGYLTWSDILHFVDVLCCLAILLPIVWSIRHLRQAAETDGKAHNNLTKLTQFRHFYILTLVYVYFTRIAVYLLSATVPFYLLWVGPFFTEVATFAFYVLTGYSFRPSMDNPYLPVRSEDSEGQEYGLDDDEGEEGFELTKRTSGLV